MLSMEDHWLENTVCALTAEVAECQINSHCVQLWCQNAYTILSKITVDLGKLPNQDCSANADVSFYQELRPPAQRLVSTFGIAHHLKPIE